MVNLVKPGWIHHEGEPIYSIDINHDGTRLASGGQDTKIKLWNTRPILSVDSEKSADDHIDKLSIRYTGKPYRRELDQDWDYDKIKSRELWKVTPKKINSMLRPQAKSTSE